MSIQFPNKVTGAANGDATRLKIKAAMETREFQLAGYAIRAAGIDTLLAKGELIRRFDLDAALSKGCGPMSARCLHCPMRAAPTA